MNIAEITSPANPIQIMIFSRQILSYSYISDITEPRNIADIANEKVT
jgi:hypothetical protein